MRPIPTALFLLIALAGCTPFQPVRETSTFVRFPAGTDEPPDDAREFAAPVVSVEIPDYLDQAIVWQSDPAGRLSPIKGYLWADSLPSALRNALSLELATADPYPSDARIDLAFERFILLEDGAAETVVSAIYTDRGGSRALPVIRKRIPAAWDPDTPLGFLDGYGKLLRALGKELENRIDPIVKNP